MQAHSILQQTHHNEAQCNSLAQQMQHYLASKPPFDKPLLPDITAKAWWLDLAANSTEVKEISELAVMLFDIVPHAASYDRIASLLGWYHTPVRSQLDPNTLAKVVAVKSDLQQQLPRYEWHRLRALPAVTL